jgi:predicted ATPase/DNA-binding CsgD family transcriptional regulator
MTTSLVSPVFVGRRDERSQLIDLVKRTVGGAPGVALIGGEAGVGKSRLVEELVSEAAALDVRVLFGNCVQLGAEGLPFAPLVDALRVLSRSMDREEFHRVLGPARGSLQRLLPNLEPELLPGNDAHEVQGPQLLELVLGLVERLSSGSPVLIVIEDLHWADRSTLELLAYLVRALRVVPVAVVGTFRSDELNRRHPLRSLLTTWERSRSVLRIDLVRFDRQEVASQLGAILGSLPENTLLDTVFDRSEGNAFLVEELLGVVMAGGDPTGLPPSLRDVLLARVDGLGPEAQRLLRTAAVGGRWVPEQLLLAVSGLEEVAAFTALREAVENHLLVVDDAGRGYSFRHTLARDAVYDDMLPGERGRLHHSYGEVLSARPEIAGDDRGAVAADLAHHWYAALDLPLAMGASVEAAAVASQRFAPAEALHHLERALQIWPRVADAQAAAGMDQVEVLRLAAQAAFAAGEVDRSLALLDQALTELGTDEPIRRAILLERKSQAFSALGMSRAGVAALTDALSLLPAEETTIAHAVVLSAMANTLMRVDDATAAASMAQRAVTAAQLSGAEQNEADAQITLGVVTAQLGDLEAGLAAGRAGIDRALAAGHPATALRGYVNLSDSLELFGRSAEAVTLATEGTALAERAGYSRSIGAFLSGNKVESLFRLGRWAEAEQLITTTLAVEPEGIFAASVLEGQGQMAALAGRYDEARAALERTQQLMGDKSESQFDSPLAFTSAELARAKGDLTGALDLLRPLLRDSHSDAWSSRYNWPLAWLGTRIQADLAIRGRDRRGPVEPLDPVFEQAAAALQVSNPPAQGFQAMCAGERARYAGDQDPQPWEAAVAIWRGVERAYELAYCLLRLTELHALAGKREAAELTVSEAHALATRIGAAPLIEQAEQLARQARLSLGAEPAAQVPTPDAPEDKLAPYALTPRELDVLLMLADGRSNPEIAKELFISPKTASVHVSNILGKLGVSGRVEAATLVHRLGLAGPPR